MNANEYQRLALRTAPAALSKAERLTNAALGLAGESGEVADTVKKICFQGHELDEAALSKELGDLCWYIALGCDALGVTMGDVMAGNIEKLRRRYPDGFSAERSINRQGD